MMTVWTVDILLLMIKEIYVIVELVESIRFIIGSDYESYVPVF